MTVLNLPLSKEKAVDRQIRPNEAGLWEREGKFYRVWETKFTGGFGCETICSNGVLGAYHELDKLPTGNWRKLTAEPAGEGEGIEKHYRRAAKQIGDLFCWCVENLKPFPPREGEWIDEVKRRLTPSPPEVIEGKGQDELTLSKHEWKCARKMIERIESMVAIGGPISDSVQVLKNLIPTFPPRPSFTAPPKSSNASPKSPPAGWPSN